MKEKKIKAPSLAAMVDTSNQQIYRLMKGQRDIDLKWRKRLGKALGVEPWELVDGAPRSKGQTADDKLIWQIMENVAELARRFPQLDARLIASIGRAVHRDALDGKLPSVRGRPKTAAVRRELERLAGYESSRPRA